MFTAQKSGRTPRIFGKYVRQLTGYLVQKVADMCNRQSDDSNADEAEEIDK